MTKITVYITNYNYGQYIEKAIESVLAQTVSDWELLVIDDGSTDDSLKRIEKFKEYEKITVIAQENKGLNVTNNVAVRLSRGKYIVRLDADDFLDENFLLVLSNLLDNRPDIGLVYSDYYHVDPDGDIIEAFRRKKIDDEVEFLDLPAHGACTMFRKDILINLGSYNEEFNCQDGYDIWIRFIEKYKPYNVNVPLFYYRQHNKSMTKNEHRILDVRRKIKKTFLRDRRRPRKKVLAFIPVLMSSIYYQNRPFVNVSGKPLLWYTLSEALKTNYFDKVILSSESQQVLDYTKENFDDIDVFMRNYEFAKYNANMVEIIFDTLKRMQLNEFTDEDAICVLPISTPLRQVKHIEHAVDTMEIFNADTILSVQEEFSPYYQHDRFGLKPINMVKDQAPRLERDAIYKGNGAIILSKLRHIYSGSLYGEKIGHITMLPEESVKLNSDYEHWLVEQIIQRNEK